MRDLPIRAHDHVEKEGRAYGDCGFQHVEVDGVVFDVSVPHLGTLSAHVVDDHQVILLN